MIISLAFTFDWGGTGKERPVCFEPEASDQTLVNWKRTDGYPTIFLTETRAGLPTHVVGRDWWYRHMYLHLDMRDMFLFR